ncbi:MAG: response regulator [Geminicoccaceae bacterium]|nr:response regulator [Geminicoccaceae bacterium]
MRQLHVLIVDGAKAERALLRQALAAPQRRLRIVEAATTASALAFLERVRFDLVFVDLPSCGDGLDLVARARALDPKGFVVVVGKDGVEAGAALGRGAGAFVAKPYTLAKVNEVLGQRARQEVLRAAPASPPGRTAPRPGLATPPAPKAAPPLDRHSAAAPVPASRPSSIPALAAAPPDPAPWKPNRPLRFL